MPNQNINIKDLREKASLSQDEFAELMGVSKRTVAYWESGQKIPQPRTFRKISELLMNRNKNDGSSSNIINPERALILAILDDYVSWKAKETSQDYKALKVAVFEKAKLILRNLDEWPF